MNKYTPLERIAIKVVDERPAPVYSHIAESVADERDTACQNCVSGSCCITEGAISLHYYDILRMSLALNLTPKEFLLKYTQDYFPDDYDNTLRNRIDDPQDSTVTFLRRKGVNSSNHCVFLKYIDDEQTKMPRLICSAHEARPLSCREFYYDGCKSRQVGELGCMVAAGFEHAYNKDPDFSPQAINDALAELETSAGIPRDFTKEFVYGLANSENLSTQVSTSDWLLRYVLKELQNVQEYIQHGDCTGQFVSNEFIELYQDPIHVKITRLFSTVNIRGEEDYGLIPNGEQLMPFKANSKDLDYMAMLGSKPIVTTPKADLIANDTIPIYYGGRMSIEPLNNSYNHPIPLNTSKLDDLLENENNDLLTIEVIEKLQRTFNYLVKFSNWALLQGVELEKDSSLLYLELFSVFCNSCSSPWVNKFFHTERDEAIRILANQLSNKLLDTEINDFSDLIHVCGSVTLLEDNIDKLDNNIKSLVEEVLGKAYSEINKAHHLVPKEYTNPDNIFANTLDTNDWDHVYDLVLNVRYFAHVGLFNDHSDVEQLIYNFYEKVIPEFCKTAPLYLNKENDIMDIYNVITHIGYGINFYGRLSKDNLLNINEGYSDLFDMINSFVWDTLYPYMKQEQFHNTDGETIGEFLDATHTNLGFSTFDVCYQNVLRLVLKTVESNGSVNSQYYDHSQRYQIGDDFYCNVPADNDEYLYLSYHGTWVVFDALRSYADTLVKN